MLVFKEADADGSGSITYKAALQSELCYGSSRTWAYAFRLRSDGLRGDHMGRLRFGVQGLCLVLGPREQESHFRIEVQRSTHSDSIT